MNVPFLERHQGFKDALSLVLFVALVAIGTIFINTFIFRSFNVEGGSMENTMHTGDRLIVNRMPVTWSKLQNKDYSPQRGQVIVFKNPKFDTISGMEEYIVKRVIAFAGERVIVKDGGITVCDNKNLNCFNPDDDNNGEPGSPTSGNVDSVVPEDALFVAGDHRQGQNSLDSRNGLGFIPLYDVVGPVSMRIFPFNGIRSF
ncbi:signal peptidase I [Candidatus Nomurabacteria bacterium]|nr:signal peptidase I [Candidatus Nomurabacteria bacterium]